MLLGIRPKKPADDRNASQYRRAIFGLLHVLPHETAKHNCLPVPYADAGRDLAGAEDRLIDHVGSDHALR